MRPSSNPRLVSAQERESFRNGYAEGLSVGAIAAALQAGGYPVRSYFGYVAIAKDLHLQLHGRIDHDRPWTDHEDSRLRSYVSMGANEGTMAGRLLRTVYGCAVRAQALGLPLKANARRRHALPKPDRQTLAVDVAALANCRPWGPATKPGYWDLGRPAA